MARKRVLERLWRLRELEEDQSRLDLEAKVGERDRIEQRLQRASEAAVESRRRLFVSLGDANTATRTGALLELERDRREVLAIAPQRRRAEAELEVRREDYLVRRANRRQVETLLESEAQAQRERVARQAQQILDDWYGSRARSRQLRLNRQESGQPPCDGASVAFQPLP